LDPVLDIPPDADETLDLGRSEFDLVSDSGVLVLDFSCEVISVSGGVGGRELFFFEVVDDLTSEGWSLTDFDRLRFEPTSVGSGVKGSTRLVGRVRLSLLLTASLLCALLKVG